VPASWDSSVERYAGPKGGSVGRYHHRAAKRVQNVSREHQICSTFQLTSAAAWHR